MSKEEDTLENGPVRTCENTIFLLNSRFDKQKKDDCQENEDNLYDIRYQLRHILHQETLPERDECCQDQFGARQP